jgi:hypothetical protein
MRKANNGSDQHHQNVYLHFQSIAPCSPSTISLSKKRSMN